LKELLRKNLSKTYPKDALGSRKHVIPALGNAMAWDLCLLEP